MNEADIKKCIKNGRAFYVGAFGEPNRVVEMGRGEFDDSAGWTKLLHDPACHATKREAQLAVSTRREQARVDARKKEGTQVPPLAVKRGNAEHKFADIPDWCPPLPEGFVPLGYGKTFRTDGLFNGSIVLSKAEWEPPMKGSGGFDGNWGRAFYAAPRNSEIAMLNYPWLKDEVASHKTPPSETQGKEVSTGETQSVLEEAMKCVGGPRRRDYGTPDENFGRIAALWNVQLSGKLTKALTPDDVAMLMILLKVARQGNSPKRDNLVDIAGYAQCASELKEVK